MTRITQASFALVFLGSSLVYAVDGARLRFEISLPGASAEQVEAEVLNVLEALLKQRPGISRIESSAVESQAMVRVTFDQAPRCSEVESITSLIEGARPKRATNLLGYLENFTCVR